MSAYMYTAAALPWRRAIASNLPESYATPSKRKPQRSRVRNRAIETDEVQQSPEPEEDEEDFRDPMDDLISLLGPRTIQSQQLTREEVFDNMLRRTSNHARGHYKAFYSSEFGGITLDPGCFLVPLDDQMVHKGHGVYETVLVVDGFMYQLPEHLQRLNMSAEMGAVPLPFSVQQMGRIALECAALGQVTNGLVKMWIGAGRGGFGLTTAEGQPSTFYCAAYTVPVQEGPDQWRRQVKTSPVPAKTPPFTAIKSTSYIENCMAALDAEADGFHQAVFVDQNGFVAGAGDASIGIINHDGELVVPPFDHSMPSITMNTLMEEVLTVMNGPELPMVNRVVQRHFTVDEAKSALECFMCTTSIETFMPVTLWDDTPIPLDGKVGKGCLALRVLMLNHIDPKYSKGQHLEVPYGYLTNMEHY